MSATSCPGCDGGGWYKEAVPAGHPNFGKLLPCECRLRARRVAQDSAARARLGDELLAMADKTFDRFDLDRPLKPLYVLDGVYYADLRNVPKPDRALAETISVEKQAGALIAALSEAERYARQWRGWLVLHGAYGAGKSHLAAAIAHAALDRAMAVRYRSMPGLFDALKAGFDNGSSDAIFDDLLHCDLLILDDLLDGDLRANDWRRSRLFRLFNERETKPTIITSNRQIDDLVSASDVDAGRLLSRVAGNASAIWLPISDYRRLKKERAA